MAAGMPWVASGDPSGRQPAAFQGAMFFHRFPSIVGAGWREAALVSNEGGQGDLIDADKADEQMLRGVHSGWPERCRVIIIHF
jgi:hypothetical protein